MISLRKKYEKLQVIEEYKTHAHDCGSSQLQVAILTKRINDLSIHLKENPKDLHSTLGIKKMVGKRTRLLSYIKRKDPQNYTDLIQKLGLRK